MLEYARWKFVLAALIALFSLIYALPNVFPQDPAIQITGTRGSKVDEALVERVRGSLDKLGVVAKSVAIEEGSLLVRLTEAEQQMRVADQLRDDFRGYVVALNLASTVPTWLDSIGARSMVLGLDLQGGVHFVMEVDQRAALHKREEALADDIRGILRGAEIRYREVARTEGHLIVELQDAAQRNQAIDLIAADLPELQIDEQSTATTLHARLREAELKALLDNMIEQNLGTLRNRVNELGVSEPVIQRQGAGRIVVQLPGVQDTALAKKILGATATLEYRAVVGDGVGSAMEAMRSGRVPPDARLYYRRDRAPDGSQIPVLLSKKVIASGDQLVDAQPGFDPQGGSPQVSVRLNNVGGQRMLEFTQESVGKPMAVVFIERIPETRMVDGKEVRTVQVKEEVISVATIQGVFGKNFQTTGLDSSEEASELALLLRAGSLAAPVDIVEERIIGPSLGKENIERGWTAVIVSFILVLIFFVIYYKTFGLITNLALLLNMLLLVAVMSLMGATLTLPGLAGIALTVGLSVDANVLINERIREELRAGNTPLGSIATGFEKASGTIADANVTALLAGIALFAFGTGPVKGFAVSLIIGILTSMYTAVSVARGLATLFYGHRRKKLSGLSI